MTTAIIISELLHVHDDALLADIEHVFSEIDRTVDKTAPDDRAEILLLVEELVEEMLAPAEPAEQLTIEITLELDDPMTSDQPLLPEVAEVA